MQCPVSKLSPHRAFNGDRALHTCCSPVSPTNGRGSYTLHPRSTPPVDTPPRSFLPMLQLHFLASDDRVCCSIDTFFIENKYLRRQGTCRSENYFTPSSFCFCYVHPHNLLAKTTLPSRVFCKNTQQIFPVHSRPMFLQKNKFTVRNLP